MLQRYLVQTCLPPFLRDRGSKMSTIEDVLAASSIPDRLAASTVEDDNLTPPLAQVPRAWGFLSVLQEGVEYFPG